jgi:hypothetical protein
MSWPALDFCVALYRVLDMRPLSSATVKVLRPFIDQPAQAQYGFGLMRSTGVRAGSLYPILKRLERIGWVEGFDEDIDERAEGRPRRRLYRLTSAGAREAADAVAAFYLSLGVPLTFIPRVGAS